MATSPRSELRIVTITEFQRSEKDGQWYWATKTANNEKVGGSMGEGYKELRKAVGGFFAQQGVTDESLTALGENSPYSKLVKVSNREYHIRKYAYGAPDPFDPAQPNAFVEKGWQPPQADDR